MMLPIIIIIPVVQLLVLSYTATFEIKKIDLGITDLDQSITSRSLISKFEASPFYIVNIIEPTYPELDEMMRARTNHLYTTRLRERPFKKKQ